MFPFSQSIVPDYCSISKTSVSDIFSNILVVCSGNTGLVQLLWLDMEISNWLLGFTSYFKRLFQCFLMGRMHSDLEGSMGSSGIGNVLFLIWGLPC